MMQTLYTNVNIGIKGLSSVYCKVSVFDYIGRTWYLSLLGCNWSEIVLHSTSAKCRFTVKIPFVYAVTQTLSSFRSESNITNNVLEIIQYQHN